MRLQFRAEIFNLFNTVNFGLPVADLNSVNFGRIFSAGPPRLTQFGLKLYVLGGSRSRRSTLDL